MNRILAFFVLIQIYIDVSGVPGVGKTISILEITKKLKKHISPKKATFIYVNAMKFSQPNQIYPAINK